MLVKSIIGGYLLFVKEEDICYDSLQIIRYVEVRTITELEKIIIESTVNLDDIYPFWHFAPKSEIMDVRIDPLKTFVATTKIDRRYLNDIIRLWENHPEKVDVLPVHAHEITVTSEDKTAYYIGDNGNHLVIAARFLRKQHIRAELQDIDYGFLPVTWGLWHDKKYGWFCVPKDTSMHERILPLYKIPDKRTLKRLCELGFKEGW